jgi:Cu/Zn superoxide dismutase
MHAFLGQVYFWEDGDTVEISGDAYFPNGVQDGLKGFHIHEFPVVDFDCDATGGHFNPYNVNKTENPSSPYPRALF